MPSVVRLSIAEFTPASRTVRFAAHGCTAPVAADTDAMPYCALPPTLAKAPPITMLLPFGVPTSALICASGAGFHGSSDPSEAENAAARARGTPSPRENVPPA